MDFGFILFALALGVLALIVGGRYGASCKACRPKASQRSRGNASGSKT